MRRACFVVPHSISYFVSVAVKEMRNSEVRLTLDEPLRICIALFEFNTLQVVFNFVNMAWTACRGRPVCLRGRGKRFIKPASRRR